MCKNWVLSGSPEPTIVGFWDLVGVGIGPVSKKMAVKYNTIAFDSTIGLFLNRYIFSHGDR